MLDSHIITSTLAAGGKLFYYWNRIVFITIYSSIVIFSGKIRYSIALFFIPSDSMYQLCFLFICWCILFLSGILALKQFTELGIGFLLALTLLTYCVDKSIENTFVIHSLHLPISIARIRDEEEVRLALFKAFGIYFNSSIWNESILS